MFEGKQLTKLKPPVDSYFAFAKLKLELSKLRAASGKKGGKTERVKVTNEEIDNQVKKGEFILSFNEFMQRNPHVKNDLYQSNRHLLDGIHDWTFIDAGLSLSKFNDCTSLTTILENRKEIVDAIWR